MSTLAVLFSHSAGEQGRRLKSLLQKTPARLSTNSNILDWLAMDAQATYLARGAIICHPYVFTITITIEDTQPMDAISELLWHRHV